MTSQMMLRSVLSSVLTFGLVLTLLHFPQTGQALTADSLTKPAVPAQGKNPDEEHDTGRCKEKEKDNDKDKHKCPPDGGSSGVAKGDFNGDNIADLAIGVPREDLGSFVDAGAVHIIYGTENGLSPSGTTFGDQLITADLLTTLEQNNFFGTSLAAGNFDGDNFSDLAIGIPGEELNNRASAGEVHVLFGSGNGLTEARGQILQQGLNGLVDTAEAGDRFGQVLNWGNFNGDDFGDLAVGLPNEDVGSIVDAGAVHVIYGSETGLTATGDQFWSQNSVLNGVEIRDASETSDQFGRALSGGDFNGDGTSDLAIGVPEEDLPGRPGVVGAGAVNVLFGTGSGLTSVFNQFWTQDDFDNLESAEDFDGFGSAVAAGDFNRDGAADLAIGVPFEDVQVVNAGQLVEVANAGAVNVLYGSIPDGGLTTAGFQFWTQATAFVNDEAEEDDRFGSALVAANFGTGHRTNAPSVHFDLAIGIPFEDVGNVANAGAVAVLYGTFEGLQARASGDSDTDQFITQVGDVETEDRFGSALTGWDFDGNGRADLAIGVPLENVGTVQDAGMVVVFYAKDIGGSEFDEGLNTTGQTWTQNSSGILDQCETGDQFGATLY
jgi:hypothetical protein